MQYVQSHLPSTPPAPAAAATATTSVSTPVVPTAATSSGSTLSGTPSGAPLSHSPSFLQDMSNESIMIAVAVYQGELNRRLLQGKSIDESATLSKEDIMLQEFSELFRSMIEPGNQSYLSQSALQMMLRQHQEKDNDSGREIFWQDHNIMV